MRSSGRRRSTGSWCAGTLYRPSKTGIKPLDYMWPVDGFKGHTEVDLDWYKDMIEKYVRGAFGFEDLELHPQKGLDAWM